jgi:hypothetical protein
MMSQAQVIDIRWGDMVGESGVLGGRERSACSISRVGVLMERSPE